VLAHQDELDAALEPFLDHWQMYRLGTVDRNVLRLGAWELTYDSELPAPIAINEAVDLAKFFSDSQSGRFVNGVLDKYSKSLQSKKSGEGQ
jgi:N utilization substance protein B